MNEFESRQGAFLPHWRLKGAIYHTVFCLRDCIPVAAIKRLADVRDAILDSSTASDAAKRKAKADYARSVASYLDRGFGSCWLRCPPVADLVCSALRYFDAQRYDLHAWCVMPNHVHAIVQPADGWDLSAILHTWKSYTAHEANKLLDRAGEFWQSESYDHIIRNGRAYHAAVRYVLSNPESAGLDPAWPWRGPM